MCAHKIYSLGLCQFLLILHLVFCTIVIRHYLSPPSAAAVSAATAILISHPKLITALHVHRFLIFFFFPRNRLPCTPLEEAVPTANSNPTHRNLHTPLKTYTSVFLFILIHCLCKGTPIRADSALILCSYVFLFIYFF